jgi:hypothetical protein
LELELEEAWELAEDWELAVAVAWVLALLEAWELEEAWVLTDAFVPTATCIRQQHLHMMASDTRSHAIDSQVRCL